MVKRYEFDLYAGGMVDDCADGLYVSHSDYASLQASHARLLEALSIGHSETMDYIQRNNLGGENNHWLVLARSAIAAAQPFTET